MIRMQGSRARWRRLPASLFVLAALAVALGAAGCAKGTAKVLVTTGSRHMTVEDFKAYARDPQVTMPYAALPESAQKKAMLEDLLSYELLAEAGTRAGYDKDSAYTQIEETALPRLLPDALYDKHIGHAVTVSDDEAKLFYEAQKTEYRLAVIMVTDAAAMPTVIGRLNKGEPFAQVARSASQDPATSQNGGEVPGWLTLGQLPPDIEKAVEPLKVGQHTGAIAQRTGTYLFAVLETRPRKDPPPFEQAKADAVKMLENRKRGALVDSYLSGLKKSYSLKVEGPGWTVVDAKVMQLPDSLARLLSTDPKRAGLSDAEMGETIATWGQRKYTIKDLATDIAKSAPDERPPANRSDLMRLFVEGKAMSDILVTEAKKEGLADSPEVKRQLTRMRSAYLVNKYIEKTLPATAVGTPTAAALDSMTHALVASMGQNAPPNLTFAMLPPQIQQQVVGDWQNRQRQAMLKTEVARLKTEIKPVIDEKALDAIPWPVPAEETKEKA